MFILQTLREFVDNPMGKGSNAIPGRQLIQNDLRNRLELLLSKPDKKISVTIYSYGQSYFFHLIIPSENTKRRNTYDVVLHFIPSEGATEHKNLNQYYVKFFSNSPSFTYTYAYAFNLNGLFVEELAGKFDERVFENPPVTRNPGEIVSYEKTIFFACQHILNNASKYMVKSAIELIAKKFNKDEFLKKIRHTETIEREIQRENNRIKREEEEEKRKSKKDTSSKNRSSNKTTGITKRTATSTSRQSKDDDLVKFMDKGKIKPRKSSISRIRPK
jgi:hypothetical protein